MNRRHFLSTSMLTALGLTACGSDDGEVDTGRDFNHPLTVPEALLGTVVNGTTSYDLTLQQGSSHFLNDVSTPTWGINGSFLGPTLRLRNGDKVRLNYTNTLGEDTTMHAHGVHLPASMDGGPHQIIKAGASWTAAFTVDQLACTNWYHPHYKGKTAQHVMNGLAGLIIVDDETSDALDLPKRYGVDDLPIIVQDRTFNSDGSFRYEPSMRETMHGWKGNTLMVNGAIRPFVDVEAKQVRFRILNGSNARVYTLAFASGRSFQQIATDNSFLESPVTLTELRLSPAERAEIVVDFS
ncbi:MAG TPA: copper oxidase, partial [Sorangium sp.]|nr:copper oxidase [Sorangium sp.]